MPPESKLAADLVPGDQVPVVRTVQKVERTKDSVVVTFADDSVSTYSLAAGANPAVTVNVPVAKKA